MRTPASSEMSEGAKVFERLSGLAACDQHVHPNSQPSVHKGPDHCTKLLYWKADAFCVGVRQTSRTEWFRRNGQIRLWPADEMVASGWFLESQKIVALSASDVPNRGRVRRL